MAGVWYSARPMTLTALTSAFTPGSLDRRAGLAAALGLVVAPLLGFGVALSPVVTAGLAVALALGSFLLGRPHYAAYAVCAGMFFTHVGIRLGPAYLDPGDLATIALLPAWMLHRLAGEARPRLIPRWWLIPTMLLWMFVSMLVSGIPPGVLGRFAREIQMFFTALALMDLLAEPRRLRIAFACASLGAFAEVLIALPQFATAYRVGGAYDQANLFAHMMAIGSVTTLALWTSARRGWLRLALLGMLGLMVLGVIMSISRGTYIALGLAMVWWVRRSRRQLMLIAVVGAIVAIFVPMLRGEENRDIQKRLEMKDDSVTHRWATVINGLNALQAHPVLGVGYGQFRQLDQAVEVTQQAGRSAHNYYLAIAAASGLPALLLYLFIVFGVMARLREWQVRYLARGAPPEEDATAVLVKGGQALMIYLVVTTIFKGVGLTLWCTIGLAAAAALLPQGAARVARPQDAAPAP